MTLRPTPDPELVPLVRAIKARIEGLGESACTPKDGVDVYLRDKTPFLQLEVRRDHMSLDVWLTGEQLDEARASGIARAHPFLGDEAVKVRFERAEDLSRVARWIEASYAYAVERAKGPPAGPIEKDTPLIKSLPPTPSRPSAPAEITSSIPAPAASTGSKVPGPAASAPATKSAKASAPAKAAPAAKKAASKKAPTKAAAKSAARTKTSKAPKSIPAARIGGAKAAPAKAKAKAVPKKTEKKAGAAKTKAKATKAAPKKKR